jgi:signal transduction histidine kinase
MPATAWPRRRAAELAWFAFAAANLGAMIRWPDWETIPFHFVWVSLTLLFGFRLWRPLPTYALLAFVWVTTGLLLVSDAREGSQPWGELFEVPLMTAMFLAMVWHAGRRQHALRTVEHLADEQASLLSRHERFLHDISHELRTPITIARGHLEVVERSGAGSRDVDVALDELARMERIVDRLLLLAKADRPDFLVTTDIELRAYLEEIFLRWSGVAPRAWHLGDVPAGTLRADPEALRDALDALLENAVKYTEPSNAIELRAHASNGDAVIEIADDGCGIGDDAVPYIFQRFARADDARSRSNGGVGLGLSIVDAIARAHGGRCTVTSSAGSTFVLRLPGFRTAPARGSDVEPGVRASARAADRPSPP